MLVPGRSGTATLEIPQLLGAKAVWTCLYSIIQHHLGSMQGAPLHKNCFMLSLCRGVANYNRVAECTRLIPEGEYSGVS